MGSPPDFYEILNIPKNSNAQEIRNAYKILAKKWHPDKHPPSARPEAEAKFKAITQAYEALHELHKTGGSSIKPEKKESTPKYASTPGRSFKDFVYSKEQGNLKGFNYLYKDSSTPDNYGRSTPGRDFMDFYYSKGATATAASSPAPRQKSFSGQLRRKPPPEERKLECTLEELYRGCNKEIKFTRDVVGKNGVIVKKQESEMIRVKPGWKKGTKITFEGMGDERPGCFPADVVFLISEKEHPIYKRVGNDLVLKVEIPLVSAVTGWNFTFRLITGEKTTCSFHDEIIYPGYEKVIQGQGMPIANEKGQRGDLRIKFNIVFPTWLSAEQKSSLMEILKDTT